MELLNNIKSSIYNPAYYSEILNKPFSYSLKYFLSLSALVALVVTIFASFSILPGISKFINEIGPAVLNYYPDNLEVTIRSGKVSTNIQEPYFIKIPAEFKNGIENKSIKNEIENLVVIDTKSPLTADLLENYKTGILISYDSIAYRDGNGAIRIQPLASKFNGVVTKAKVSSALDKIAPYLKILPPILVPIIFIVSFIGSILGNLIYLIFGAFVIWIAAKIRNRKLAYGKAYQIGLHAITLGVVLEATVFWFYPNLEFPLLFTILMLASVWVNLKTSSNIDNPSSLPTQMPISGGEIK